MWFTVKVELTGNLFYSVRRGCLKLLTSEILCSLPWFRCALSLGLSVNQDILATGCLLRPREKLQVEGRAKKIAFSKGDLTLECPSFPGLITEGLTHVGGVDGSDRKDLFHGYTVFGRRARDTASHPYPRCLVYVVQWHVPRSGCVGGRSGLTQGTSPSF